MGSCLSRKWSLNQKDSSLAQHDLAAGRRPSLSPPLPEEEAVVKEVLMETPRPSSFTARSNPSRRLAELEVKPPGRGAEAAASAGGRACRGEDSSKERSEICSVSECLSASSTLTERRGGGAEKAEVGEEGTSVPGPHAAKWRPPEWSPAGKSYQQRSRYPPGEFHARGDASVGASGSIRSPSPLKPPEGRPFIGREAVGCRHQAGNGNAAPGKDYGYGPGSRPVPPAAKVAADLLSTGGGGGGVSRSASMRKAGMPSPRRAHALPAAAPGTTIRRTAAAGPERDGGPPPLSRGPIESVENPLVSLECFIFL